jgi:hypothetical protein
MNRTQEEAVGNSQGFAALLVGFALIVPSAMRRIVAICGGRLAAARAAAGWELALIQV